MQCSDRLLDSRDNPDSILGALEELLSGQEPRSVLCAGYCVGGTLATLASPWSALRWPNADVRCITVGSPKLGNKEFAEVYSWLVGLSYRGHAGWVDACCVCMLHPPRRACMLQLECMAEGESSS